jgi:hypothetical protein
VKPRGDSGFLKAQVWAENHHCTVMLRRNENLAPTDMRPVQVLLQSAGADRVKAAALQKAALQLVQQASAPLIDQLTALPAPMTARTFRG